MLDLRTAWRVLTRPAGVTTVIDTRSPWTCRTWCSCRSPRARHPAHARITARIRPEQTVRSQKPIQFVLQHPGARRRAFPGTAHGLERRVQLRPPNTHRPPSSPVPAPRSPPESAAGDTDEPRARSPPWSSGGRRRPGGAGGGPYPRRTVGDPIPSTPGPGPMVAVTAATKPPSTTPYRGGGGRSVRPRPMIMSSSVRVPVPRGNARRRR